MKKIKWFICKVICKIGSLNIIPVSDELFIRAKYYSVFGKKLNLENPKTFNEKLQWLKLHDRKDIYTTMVDKYEVKNYVSKIIGEEYIIPTLGVYNSFDEIDFNILPNQFVIKCTHDSGSTIVVKDKKSMDYITIRKKINRCLKTNFYLLGREWPYKNVKPRIIIEKYMIDKQYKELRDYKVYAFNGSCDYCMLCFDRVIGSSAKFIYFDKNWNIKKDFSNDGIKYGESINVPKPIKLNKMFEFASKLSKGIPFVRVDFYEANGNLYLGELTFFPSAGLDDTRTSSVTKYLDEKLKINIK